MQSTENCFTGRDLDFSITQHTCCQGRLLETTLIGYISWKNTRFYSAQATSFFSVTAVHYNEFCCLSLESHDRVHVQFIRVAVYFCNAYQQMGRRPAYLPRLRCVEAQREQQEQMGARWMTGWWDRAVYLIFNQWRCMLLLSGGERRKWSQWNNTDCRDAGIKGRKYCAQNKHHVLSYTQIMMYWSIF